MVIIGFSSIYQQQQEQQDTQQQPFLAIPQLSMKIASNATDQRDVHEFAAITSNDDGDHLASTRCHGDGNAAADDDDNGLNLEVKHFLETECYPGEDARQAALLLQADIHDDASLEEEMYLMDVNESIDVPDLDFSDFAVTEATSELCPHTLVVKDEPTSPPSTSQNAKTARRIAPPEKKLRVIIPVSVFTPPVPTHQPHPPQEQKMTTGRKRAKDELEYLRQQVKELEGKLTELQQSPTNSDNAHEIDGSEAEGQLEPSHVHLWKRIAEHQLDQKRKSEVENAKLKDLLEGQLKIARSLSKVIHKRPDLTWLESSQSPAASASPRFPSTEDSEGVFETLAQRLDSVYAQMDLVFAETGFADSQSAIREGQVKTDAQGRIFLEVLDCNIMPFDLHATSAGVWKLLSLSSFEVANGTYQAIDSTNDIVRGQFTLTLKLRRSETLLHVRMLGRRIVEANRVVLVWCTLGDSKGSLFGQERVHIRESGWTVIQEIPMPPCEAAGNHGAENPRLTKIQTVVRMTPELEDSADNSNHVGVLTHVIFGAFHQSLTIMHQMIENIILADTLERGFD